MNSYKTIGQTLRGLRESKGLLVRQVAAHLEVDPSYLSKLERGDKRPTRIQIERLAEILGTDLKQLMIDFLSDRLVYEVRDEDLAIEAMKVAEQKIEYLKKSNTLL